MVTIILTTTVNVYKNIDCIFQTNPNDRINTYLSSIREWLYKTNFNIVVVENSGYMFNELDKEKIIFKNRFECITFNESTLYAANIVKNLSSKGKHELFAINYAFSCSSMLQSSSFIIKITGRFYIPDFEKYINNYNLNEYDCLVQNDRDRCEMIGSNIENFFVIFNMSDNTWKDENLEYISKLRTSQYKKILICDQFKINETQRGGLNQTYTTI
jgi:hypothetical protein